MEENNNFRSLTDFDERIVDKGSLVRACFRRPLVVDSMNQFWMALGHGAETSCSRKLVLGLVQELHRSS